MYILVYYNILTRRPKESKKKRTRTKILVFLGLVDPNFPNVSGFKSKAMIRSVCSLQKFLKSDLFNGSKIDCIIQCLSYIMATWFLKKSIFLCSHHSFGCWIQKQYKS